MRTNYYLFSVAIALSAASSANAAQPVLLQNTSIVELKQKFQLSLPGAMNNTSTSSDSLHFVRKHTDKKRVTHTRLQQYYAGFPVFGGYAITHSAYATQFLAFASSEVQINGVVYQGLKDELGQANPLFLKNTSEALKQFTQRYLNKELSEERVTPMIYIDDLHQAHWAYKVSVLIASTDSIPERPTAIIDATTYEPFVQWNDVKTERSLVKGVGFGGNKKTGIFQYGKELNALDLTRDASTAMCYMENATVKIVDMANKTNTKNKIMQFSCKTNFENQSNTYMTGYKADGYDRANGAASPSNDALYVGSMIKQMYHDWYSLEALVNPDGTPMPLVMRVHYGQGYENAYWDGDQMTFGDGEDTMYPLVSLGIGGHEVSHGFTEQHSALEYFGQSGGMNESFSDMAAQAIEFYASGKNNWKIGSEIMKEERGYEALRFMDRPSLDGKSIERADEYKSNLNVHYSSGVYNRLFYLLASQPSWSVRKAFDVMVKANMDYWTPYSTFDEGGCGVLHASKDLGYSMDDVKQALNEVHINYQSCIL